MQNFARKKRRVKLQGNGPAAAGDAYGPAVSREAWFEDRRGKVVRALIHVNGAWTLFKWKLVVHTRLAGRASRKHGRKAGSDT